MGWLANLKVGRADVEPDLPSHTPGVRQGNEPGSFEKQAGHITVPAEQSGTPRPTGRSTAARSTGINPEARNPIHPESPNLSPG